MTSSRGDDPTLPADRMRRILENGLYQARPVPSRKWARRPPRPTLICVPKDPEGRRAFDLALRRLNEGGIDEPGND